MAGPDDPRLGKSDSVLVTHLHGDHAGNVPTLAPNAGSCENPDLPVSALPQYEAAEIAYAKKAKIVT